MSKHVKVNRLFGHYPTMVANGRGGHPRHRYSARLRMNPSADDELESAMADLQTKGSGHKKSEKLTVHTKGDTPALVKARAVRKANLEALALQEAAKELAKASKKKVYQRKYPTDEALKEYRISHGREAIKLAHAARSATAAQKRAEKAAKKAERHEKALANKYVRKYPTDEALKAYRQEHGRQLGLSRKGIESKLAKIEKASAKTSMKLSQLEKLFPPFRVDYVGSSKQELVANGKRGRGYMSRLLASNPGKKGRPAGQKNKPKASTLFGPYKFTLLKNPIVDFEVGGIKILPALAGIAGTSLLTNIVEIIPQYKDISKDAWYKPMIPGAVAVAVAALGYSYAKKKNNKLAMQVCSDVAAFGIFSALNGKVNEQVKSLVDKVSGGTKAPDVPKLVAPAGEPAKGMSGGQFFEMPSLTGGVRAYEIPEQMNGYVLKGQQGYPQIAMTGEQGYPPASMYGRSGADSAALQAIALAGGAYHSLGHSMSEYAE